MNVLQRLRLRPHPLVGSTRPWGRSDGSPDLRADDIPVRTVAISQRGGGLVELSAVVQEPLQNTIVVYIYMYTPDITMETLPVWVSVQSGAAG